RATAAPFETLRGPGPAALRPSTESARPRAQKPTPFPGRPDHSARGLRSNTSAAGDCRAPTFNGECPSSGTETHVVSGPPRTFCPPTSFEHFCGRDGRAPAFSRATQSHTRGSSLRLAGGLFRRIRRVTDGFGIGLEQLYR